MGYEITDPLPIIVPILRPASRTDVGFSPLRTRVHRPLLEFGSGEKFPATHLMSKPPLMPFMTAASGAAHCASMSPLASSGSASGVGRTFSSTSRPSFLNSPFRMATWRGATYSALSVPVAMVSLRGFFRRLGAGAPLSQRAGERSPPSSAGSVQ